MNILVDHHDSLVYFRQMFQKCCCLALVGSLMGCLAGENENQTTDTVIWNGESTWAFPSVGYLFGGKQGCTGTVIAPHTVLTAAHCIFDPDSNYTVPAPPTHFQFMTEGGVVGGTIPLDSYFVAPEFFGDSTFDPNDPSKPFRFALHDLAIVKLAYASPVSPLPITGWPPREGAHVMAIGAGTNWPSSRAVRHFGWQNPQPYTDSIFQAGDSGAPIFNEWGQIFAVHSNSDKSAGGIQRHSVIGSTWENGDFDFNSAVAVFEGQ